METEPRFSDFEILPVSNFEAHPSPRVNSSHQSPLNFWKIETFFSTVGQAKPFIIVQVHSLCLHSSYNSQSKRNFKTIVPLISQGVHFTALITISQLPYFLELEPQTSSLPLPFPFFLCPPPTSPPLFFYTYHSTFLFQVFLFEGSRLRKIQVKGIFTLEK